MCEPYHSINQFPDTDPDSGDPMVGKIESAFGKVAAWAKKIGSWFHFSKVGSGHSEAIRYTNLHYGRIPEPTRYEAEWWNRSVRLDGGFWEKPKDHEDALESATVYAHQVSIGNLQMLRRFLEASVQQSNNKMSCLNLFPGMLNSTGKEIWRKKLKSFSNMNVEQMLKSALGLTRKRELLIPEWADDNKIWTPSHHSSSIEKGAFNDTWSSLT